MSEPTTDAGRVLLDNPGGTREVRAWAIAEIERQAAAGWKGNHDKQVELKRRKHEQVAALREALLAVFDASEGVPEVRQIARRALADTAENGERVPA